MSFFAAREQLATLSVKQNPDRRPLKVGRGLRLRRGRVHASGEGLAALRAARTGKKASPETKAKTSAASKERELNKRILRLMDPYRWT